MTAQTITRPADPGLSRAADTHTMTADLYTRSHVRSVIDEAHRLLAQVADSQRPERVADRIDAMLAELRKAAEESEAVCCSIWDGTDQCLDDADPDDSYGRCPEHAAVGAMPEWEGAA